MLTPAIRAYLEAARNAGYLLTRVAHELITEFGLTSLEAGEVIAADIRATLKEGK